MNSRLATLPARPKVDLRQLPVLAKNQIDSVSLPKNYIAARKALQKCVRVDECKDMADKHAALAVYAKQIKDDSLRYYAERVHLRALIRVGELLREFKRGSDRKAAYTKQGLSVSHANDCVNMARLGKKARERLIEKTPPVSKSAMALEGRKLGWGSDGSTRDRFEVYARIEKANSPYGRIKDVIDGAHEGVKHLAPDDCKVNGSLPSAKTWALMLKKDEGKKIREKIILLIEWLDEFEQAISTGD